MSSRSVAVTQTLLHFKYTNLETLALRTQNWLSILITEILELHCVTVAMAEEKDAFFVVRKGDVVGIYKSFSDIEPLLASSVPGGESLSIYKGFSLPQKTEEYLVSHGLKGAPYSISAAEVHEGLFGRLVACPYQVLGTLPSSWAVDFCVCQDLLFFFSFFFLVQKVAGSSSFPTNLQKHHALGGSQAQLSSCFSCILEFDGASKGNPGPAGAGAILRAEDGSKVYRLREGVGTQTNNVAEYRGLILGLKQALKKGYKHIRVQGDSLLVCNQIQGLWKIKNQNMAHLCNEAKELKDKFLSFKINHVLREYNSEADVQANLAVNLKGWEIRGSTFTSLHLGLLLKMATLISSSSLHCIRFSSSSSSFSSSPSLGFCSFPLRFRTSTLKAQTIKRRVAKAMEEETQQQQLTADSEQPSSSEQQPVVVPVSPSDTLTMFFQAEGTMSETAIPALTKAVEETEGVTDLKVRLVEGLAIIELKKQTTVQATGVASGLVETIQGLGFKLQTLNLSFEDEEVAVA
ncbi:hypothetical protein VNO77_35429 [Canavalia gladiata]|uniref:RNase H type-1 domain-containing protein n=1 Tax=Canavalia gladiata TaxID=3824 RepID=A0AAN9KGH5_CANGL